MLAHKDRQDAVSDRQEGSSLFRCRLCRQVGITVFLSILLLEGATLFYFSRNFEKERLIGLEQANFAAIQSLFIGATPSAERRGLLADAKMLIHATDIRGGALFTNSGTFIGVFGESPKTRLYEVTAGRGNGRLLADKTRYEVVWQFKSAGPSLTLIARLDASQIKAEVTDFFWSILALVVVISLIVTAVTMFILGRSTLTPILLLRQSLLAAGKNPSDPEKHKILLERNDEVGEAFGAFNRMLDRLSISNKEINQRQALLNRLNIGLELEVEERTASLTEAYEKLEDEVAERLLAEERVKYLAYYDALTGLPNRTLFTDRVNQILTQSRTPAIFAIHIIDLDYFKDVNDSLGHAIGDALLVATGERLKACVRATDTVARLGGDEFSINQMDINGPDDAATLAVHIIDVLSEPYFIEGHTIHCQASIGITVYPNDGKSYEQLLKNADMALYRAKEEGRRGYRFFTNEMNTQAETRRNTERDLRNAIENQEFSISYEAQVDLNSDRISGIEALLRWRHPVLGDLAPNNFIQVAERSRLILPIGEWVFREACRQNKALQETGLSPISVAVNLSVIQLKQENIAERIAAILNETRLDPKCVDVEITESVIMDDIKTIKYNLDQLKELGVQLTVDDFGTGYSSFSLLKKLPVDRIKIDRSFIHDLMTNSDSAAIVKATIMLGHSLDLTVVAEGVETEDQEQFLISHGCDLGQGKFYGGPYPAGELESVLKKTERTRRRQWPRTPAPSLSLVHDSDEASKIS